MSHLSGRTRSPEAEELERKQHQLAHLEIELSERELELTTLRAELAALERRYLQVVGRRYAQLDRIESEIAEELARRNPADSSIQATPRKARETANESAEEAPGDEQTFGGSTSESVSSAFKPSDELQHLYRRAAQALHPDLTTDPAEKERRRRIMSEVNKAFEEGDEERIRQLLRTWHGSPENVEGEGTAAELVRVIRKIAQVRQRLVTIRKELEQTRESDLFQLKTRVDKAACEGRDLLQEMAQRVNADIDAAQKRWNRLVRIRTRQIQ